MVRWERGIVLERIRQWTRLHGKPPTADGWKSSVVVGDTRFPSAHVVAARFNGFRAALLEAGVVDPTMLPRERGRGELKVVKKQANEYWYGAWTVDGQRIRRSLGAKTGRDAIGRYEAERRLAAAMGRDVGTPQAGVDRVYAHLRKALSEADRLRLDGEARRQLDASVAAMHKAEDGLLRALGYG